MRNRFLFVFLAFIVLAVTGCNSDVNDSNGVGYVRFADEFEVSRGLSEKNTLMYPVDSLYWAYTAQKVDGLYTEGESEVLGDSSETGSDGVKAGGYKLRPVKQGPATGLRDAEVGPFATGDWIFKVYGYLNYKVDSSTGKGMFDGLVYSGKTATLNNVSRVVKVDSGTGEPVVFELTDVSTTTVIPDTGEIGFEALKITVPEDMRFFGTSEIKVKVFDVTDAAASDTTLLGTSTTTISADKNPSDANPVALNNVLFKTDTSNVLDKKLHTLKIVAEYHDTYTEAMKSGLYKDDKGYDYSDSSYAGVLDKGYALIGEFEKEVDIRKGVKTVLYGDINDIRDSSEKTQQVDDGVIIAKILKDGGADGSTDDADYDFYTSIADAAAAYSTHDSHPIILVNDVAMCGKISQSVTIDPANHVLRELYVSGDGVTVTISPGNDSNRRYALSGNKATLVSFGASGNTVDIFTTFGNLSVTAPDDDIWHSGIIHTLEINSVKKDTTNNKGYHLWADVNTQLNITKGYVELGDYKTIKELTLGDIAAGDVILRGKLTTTVSNIDQILNGRFKSTEDVGSMTDKQKAVFKKVILNGNGGFIKGSSTVESVTLYGIDGMYLTLPVFKATTRTSHVCTNPIFEKTNSTFLRWRVTSADGAVGYADVSKIVVGVKPEDGKTVQDEINLYAQWTLPLGGKIFAARTFDCSSYTFYDADGKIVVGDLSSLENFASSLSSAVSYATNNDNVFYRSEDTNSLFIFNEDVWKYFRDGWFHLGGGTDSEGVGVEVSYYDAINKKNRTVDNIFGNIQGGWGTTFPMYPGSTVLGAGKSSTEWYMNLAGYWNGTTPDRPSMDPARYTGNENTVWYKLKEFNTASDDNEDNTTGLYDWFVGSAGELYHYLSVDGTPPDLTGSVGTSSRGTWSTEDHPKGSYAWYKPGACTVDWQASVGFYFRSPYQQFRFFVIRSI